MVPRRVEQLAFRLPNVLHDSAIYELSINGKTVPFYKISIISTDNRKRPTGTIEIFYNPRYILLTIGKISTSKTVIANASILMKIPEDKDYREAVRELVVRLSKRGVSYLAQKNIAKTALAMKKLTKFKRADLSEFEMPFSEESSGLKGKIKKYVLTLAVPLIPVLLALGYEVLYPLYKAIKIKKIRQEASIAEREGEIEMLRRGVLDTSIRAIKTLVDNVMMFVTKDVELNGLLIIGDSGIGKTFTVKRILLDHGLVQGKDYGYIRLAPEESAQFVELLYMFRDTPLVILDDADHAIDNPVERQILLQLLESSPVRVINVPKSVALETSGGRGVVLAHLDKFLVKSKFIIISNKTIDEIPANIRTRCFIVNYHLNDYEIFKIIQASLKNIAQDLPMDVKVDILTKLSDILKRNNMKLSFRQLHVAIAYYRMYGNEWDKYYEYTIKTKV